MNQHNLAQMDNLKFLASSLDRSLPVPLRTQLNGLIKFGISTGALPSGTKLPSVRMLAEATGIAPMTISTAYRELQLAGAVVTRQGAGTYVTDAAVGVALKTHDLQRITERLDELLDEARRSGLSATDLAAMIFVRVNQDEHRRPPASSTASVHAAFVGIFPSATEAYAQDLARYMKPEDRITPITIEELRAAPDKYVADLYISLPTRLREVSELVKRRAPVASVNVIPSSETRAFLAAIDPNATLALVSTFPGFLALMKPNVRSFAPHVRNMVVAQIDDVDLKDKLHDVDVVVYATGADAVLDYIPSGTIAAEYRHVPDPHAVKTTILPLLERLRTERS